MRGNNRCSQSYLYFWLDLPDMTERIKALNSNSAQPGINQNGVRSLPILIPPPEVLRRFDEFVGPLLSQLFCLAKMNRVLYESLDLLLPRLISHKLDVSCSV